MEKTGNYQNDSQVGNILVYFLFLLQENVGQWPSKLDILFCKTPFRNLLNIYDLFTKNSFIDVLQSSNYNLYVNMLSMFEICFLTQSANELISHFYRNICLDGFCKKTFSKICKIHRKHLRWSPLVFQYVLQTFPNNIFERNFTAGMQLDNQLDNCLPYSHDEHQSVLPKIFYYGHRRLLKPATLLK